MHSQPHPPTQNQPNPLNRRGLWFILTLCLILLLAAWLRFYHLSGPSLWADEGNSVALAGRGWVEIAQRTAFDIHPPLYYWLLKIWTTVFGTGEVSLRSLSALLGVGVVCLTGMLGTHWFGPRLGLLAAFIGAMAPLQVYYSQEARMYMLLTFLSCLTVLTATWLWQNDRRPQTVDWGKLWLTSPAGIIYVLTVTAGLYTHYAYPVILLAVNLAYLRFTIYDDSPRSEAKWDLRFTINNHSSFVIRHASRPFANWLLLQLIPLMLYLPWLPTAWRQITTWPAEPHPASLWTALQTIATTLLFGLSWPYHTGPMAVIIIGLTLLLTLKVQRSTINLLHLWFILPVTLTLVVFSPAFLKFLLVAAPALALLLALALSSLTFYGLRPFFGRLRFTDYLWQTRFKIISTVIGSTLLAVLSAASLISLYHYYTNPAFARDNYRAVAGFIQAVGGPNDAVILHAEGQQDVFNYYYATASSPEAPVYPLPRRRPLDEAATLAELQTIANHAHKVYVVYWASQQADPSGLIEGWLETHLLKATDQWYGNIRLATYVTPQAVEEQPMTPIDVALGPHLRLVGQAIPSTGLTPGDILPVALRWQTDAPLPAAENYTVFIQLLDPLNHLVGQRDAPLNPPAAAWAVNQRVTTGYGVLIEPGTPPGNYRLIAGLYDSATGQRLTTATGQDFVELGQVEVVRPASPLPLEAYNIQTPLNESMLEVDLLGYDLYKLGQRSAPETPLHPGDPVQLTAYWRANRPIEGLEDQLSIRVVTLTGAETPLAVTLPPAGMAYPIQHWPPGDIIRAQYTFFLNDLPPGSYRLALTLNSGETSTQLVTALTQPFKVEP